MLLVFALYKPTNLRSEYVSILVMIYLAAFTGSSVGSLLGAALTYFNLDLAMLVMVASLSHSSIEAIDTTLWGFTAATVSYLRRGAGRGSDDLPLAARAGGWAQIAAP